MGKVNLLPDDVISKIAAGEVIERPASCVKELLENALDAGSTDTSIHIEKSGKSLIQIQDNGFGIDPDDMKKIFSRHATSKISSFNDLDRLNSLGFRGEALYSIAAVSDINVSSRTAGSENGWYTHLRGGQRLESKPAGTPNGTQISVRELFFNTPARRKFLKSDSAEFIQIVSTVIPYTLLSTGTAFSLTHNKKNILTVPKGGTLTNRIAQVLRINRDNIIESFAKSEDNSISVRLFLGDINIQRPKKDLQFIFLNGRPVQNRGISFNMNQIYKLILPAGINPFFAVFISMPSQLIDVNIHPTKREVKIRGDRALITMLRRLTENALMSSGDAKKIHPDLRSSIDKDTINDGIKDTAQKYILKKPDIISDAETTSRSMHSTAAAKQYSLFTGEANDYMDNAARKTRNSGLRKKLFSSRFIGAFIKKYLLFEGDSSILFIDQHASQERITFECFLGQINEKRIETQGLLSPRLIRLSHQEMLAWNEVKDRLESIGFSTTQWDTENIAVHTYPNLINSIETAVRNILSGEKAARVDTLTLAKWACKASIKTGDALSTKEALALKDNLLKASDPFTCPHGRPTVLEIEEKFLNRQFLR